MSATQWLGVALLAVLFAHPVACTVVVAGWREALAIWAIAAVGTAAVLVSIALLVGDLP